MRDKLPMHRSPRCGAKTRSRSSCQEIDELYLNSAYYIIVPDGEVGQQAFAVIREAIRQEGMVAIGKVVFTSTMSSCREKR